MFDSTFALFLAIVLLDAMEGVSEAEHYELDMQIEGLVNSMDDYDLGYFECVLDLVHITRAN